MNLVLTALLPLLAGLVLAFAAQKELRATPRAALATAGFRVLALHVACSILPASLAFYLLQGDWFLLYLVDVQRVPSAVSMLLFSGVFGVAAMGYLAGASLVRAQRDTLLAVLLGVAATLTVVCCVAVASRVRTVGTYAQFHGSFGLKSWAQTAVMPGVVLANVVHLAALVHAGVRTRFASTRRAS